MPNTIKTLRSGGASHSEEIVNFLSSRLVEVGGVFDKVGGDFLCEEQAVPNMTVKVNEGYAFIPKSDGSMVYPIRSYDGDYSATIGANASGNPRIDTIVLYIDLAASPDTNITNVAKIAVVAGTPAASPSAPTDFAVGTAIGASNPFIRLANVAVSSGETAINTADITDVRDAVVVSHKFDFSSAIKAVLLDTTAENENAWSGITQNLVAGESLVFGNVVYMKSDEKAWKADADAESTAPAIAMALGTIAADGTGLFLMLGTAQNASWSFTVGGKVYLSNTTGGVTQTAPSGADDVIQLLGVATDSDKMLFNPQTTYVVHT